MNIQRKNANNNSICFTIDLQIPRNIVHRVYSFYTSQLIKVSRFMHSIMTLILP